MLRPGERRGLAVLTAILLGSILIRVLWAGQDEKELSLRNSQFVSDMLELQEKMRVKEKERVSEGPEEYYKERDGESARERVLATFDLSYFDPNNVSYETLVEMNIPDFVARNLISYRSAGAVFREPESLRRIYGMDRVLYEALQPYVRIEGHDGLSTRLQNKSSDPKLRGLPALPSPEVNTSDSIELQLVPGIGPSYARRIIKYRDMLGGFYTFDQLWEVYGMDSSRFYSLIEHCILDTMAIKKVDLQTASFRELISHPYIDREMTIGLLELRDFADTLKSVAQIRKSHIIDPEKLQKVIPYLGITTTQ